MNARGRSKIVNVALKLLQVILATIPLLLGFVFHEAYWQDHGGSPASLVDNVFSIIFLTAGAYVVCGMFYGLLIGLGVIVRALFVFLGGKTESSNHPEVTNAVGKAPKSRLENFRFEVGTK